MLLLCCCSSSALTDALLLLLLRFLTVAAKYKENPAQTAQSLSTKQNFYKKTLRKQLTMRNFSFFAHPEIQK
jgi:hypothetical protein